MGTRNLNLGDKNELLALIWLLSSRSGGSSGGGGSDFLLFQPGGVAGPGVFTTWPTLATASAAIASPKTIGIDDTFAAAHIPVGAWNLGPNPGFVSARPDGTSATLTADNGASISSPPGSDLLLAGRGLQLVLNGTAPLFSTPLAVGATVTIGDPSSVVLAGTAPAVTTAGDATIVVGNGASVAVSGTGPVFQVNGTAQVAVGNSAAVRLSGAGTGPAINATGNVVLAGGEDTVFNVPVGTTGPTVRATGNITMSTGNNVTISIAGVGPGNILAGGVANVTTGAGGTVSSSGASSAIGGGTVNVTMGDGGSVTSSGAGSTVASAGSLNLMVGNSGTVSSTGTGSAATGTGTLNLAVGNSGTVSSTSTGPAFKGTGGAATLSLLGGVSTHLTNRVAAGVRSASVVLGTLSAILSTTGPSLVGTGAGDITINLGDGSTITGNGAIAVSGFINATVTLGDNASIVGVSSAAINGTGAGTVTINLSGNDTTLLNSGNDALTGFNSASIIVSGNNSQVNDNSITSVTSNNATVYSPSASVSSAQTPVMTITDAFGGPIVLTGSVPAVANSTVELTTNGVETLQFANGQGYVLSVTAIEESVTDIQSVSLWQLTIRQDAGVLTLLTPPIPILQGTAGAAGWTLVATVGAAPTRLVLTFDNGAGGQAVSVRCAVAIVPVTHP